MTRSITPDELAERLASGDELVVIDVLPRVRFEREHLPRAQHASLYDDDFLERVEALVDDPSTEIVVYCGSTGCNASAKAAQRLREAGYGHVLDLEGGLRAWADAGLPVRGRKPRR